MYKSQYYENYGDYERFGNIIVDAGSEVFLYIQTDRIQKNRYSISNKLRVYDYKIMDFVAISTNTDYPTVNLYLDDGSIKTFLLHRLYMITFCYEPGCELKEVNHIDGNKLNDNPYNLEWMTHEDNMRHAFDNGLINKKLSDIDIIEVIKLANALVPVRKIAEQFGVSSGYIQEIIRGRKSGKQMTRINRIKSIIPVVKPENTAKLSDELLSEIATKYNDGMEYHELSSIYSIDRSFLTKKIKEYAITHPEIVIRPLKKFTDEEVKSICELFESNRNMPIRVLCDLCIEFLGLDNTESNRKAIRNIYNGKTYRHISSNYSYQ